jgi:ParB-like chromosome segregation protein Spo0J
MTIPRTPTDLPSVPAVPGMAVGKPAARDATAPPGELAEVNRTAPGPDLTEIGRRAAHLAAFQRAVLPVAEARLSDGAARAAELRHHARELATTLYWLDRHLTGDSRAAAWPTRQISQEVHQAAADYTRAERALAGALAEALDARDMTELVKAYHRAALGAPTRAHPRLSYRGLTGRLAFRLAAYFDDVRDGTDNRPVGSDVSARAAGALRDLEGRTVEGTPALPVGSRSLPALANS